MNLPGQRALLNQCREAFSAALASAAGEIGIRSPALIESLKAGAARAFDELAGLHSEEEYKRLRGVTASRISLVHPEDMDLTVGFINLTHDLADACEVQLHRLHLLFMSLLEQDNSVLDQLPVGPEAVCIALRAMCDQGELTGEVRLDIPARILHPLTLVLRHLYVTLTDQLQAAGVPPKSLLRQNSESSTRTHFTQGAAETSDGSGMGYSRANQESLSEARRYDNTPLNRLQDTLMRRAAGPAGNNPGGNFGSNNHGAVQIDASLAAAIVDRVFVWLSERQQSAAAQPYGTPNSNLNLSELRALLPAESNAAIDAIGLSFDELLTDKRLPPAVKPSLERLRLPLSKLALIDPHVLADAQHPARQFVDSFLGQCLSLPADAPADSPLCKSIETLAQHVQEGFERDTGIFEEAKNQLDAMSEASQSGLKLFSAPLIQIAEREVMREHSRSRAARAVRALCAGNVPASVTTFLEQLWVRVLATIHQHAGEKSEAWRRALATANQLVESVQPKADAAARQQLVASLPQLINQLRAGLDAIGTPETLRERAFHSFVNYHKAVILGRPLPSQSDDLLEIASEARIEKLSEAQGLHVVRLPPEAELRQGPPEWVHELTVGHWIDLRLPDETRSRRLFISWSNGSPRLLLGVERGGAFSIIFPLRWLQQAANEGLAQRFVPEGAFERAAETAIDRYH